ncbi:MAG: CpsB/CapC family capsule biosynthesis tyrosine phosphatase, partial [Bacteroidota bacterium]|nr:CpsB/CapC family capsule biosynthesis tyrosine phosphatase [Bacteroidota bacterium]
MHSHLIAGIDDGSPDLETSVQIIKNLQSLGFKKVITTPHTMHDFYRNTPEIILGGLKDLQDELKKQSVDVEVSAAAEYYIDYDFEAKVDSGDK